MRYVTLRGQQGPGLTHKRVEKRQADSTSTGLAVNKKLLLDSPSKPRRTTQKRQEHQSAKEKLKKTAASKMLPIDWDKVLEDLLWPESCEVELDQEIDNRKSKKSFSHRDYKERRKSRMKHSLESGSRADTPGEN